MRISIFLIAVISTIFFSACTEDEVKPKEFALDQPDAFAEMDYQVYAAILQAYDFGFYTIRQQTSNYTVSADKFELFFNLSDLQNMEANLYQKFLDANQVQKMLDDKIVAEGHEIKLIPNQEFEYYFEEPNQNKAWDRFTLSYPKSKYRLLSFNSIAYNSIQNQAMVAMQYYFGKSVNWQYQTDEYGVLIYLEKDASGNWEVIRTAIFDK